MANLHVTLKGRTVLVGEESEDVELSEGGTRSGPEHTLSLSPEGGLSVLFEDEESSNGACRVATRYGVCSMLNTIFQPPMLSLFSSCSL